MLYFHLVPYFHFHPDHTTNGWLDERAKIYSPAGVADDDDFLVELLFRKGKKMTGESVAGKVKLS